MSKIIKGITYGEFVDKVIESFEVEYEDGGRRWISSNEFTSKAEYNVALNKFNRRGLISDFDIVCHEQQPVEIVPCLEELDRLQKLNKGEFLSWSQLFDMYGEDTIIGYELPKGNLVNTVKAGKATITLHSGTTGKHFTYQVKKHKDKDLWFVSLMVGTNNDSDFAYLGYFYNDNKFKRSDKSCRDSSSPSFLAFEYFLNHIKSVPEKLGVYHSGNCCRCGRTLTTPESIEAGIGPECSKMVEVA
jgi:hypothetical protein